MTPPASFMMSSIGCICVPQIHCQSQRTTNGWTAVCHHLMRLDTVANHNDGI